MIITIIQTSSGDAGDYTDVETLSCQTNFDMLFDWLDLKRSMSLWLRASLYTAQKNTRESRWLWC